jgi:hypothetical protein
MRKALSSIRVAYRGVAELGLKNVKNVHNVGLYILLLELD